MKVPSKTPQEMLEFWEAELAEMEAQQEIEGVTIWSINFAKAERITYLRAALVVLSNMRA